MNIINKIKEDKELVKELVEIYNTITKMNFDIDELKKMSPEEIEENRNKSVRLIRDKQQEVIIKKMKLDRKLTDDERHNIYDYIWEVNMGIFDTDK